MPAPPRQCPKLDCSLQSLGTDRDKLEIPLQSIESANAARSVPEKHLSADLVIGNLGDREDNALSHQRGALKHEPLHERASSGSAGITQRPGIEEDDPCHD